jgi:arylsulfatase A-like enzyme
MDHAIGELLDALEDSGVDDETLVIFFSDNGGGGNGGNAPLRGGKSTMWEGGLRAPFIARWPGHLPEGRVTSEFLSMLELFPTFAALAGTPLPEGVHYDGFDMMPVLQGKLPSQRRDMFWERRSHRAARFENWKWIESSRGGGLFDLDRDLGERNDISNEHPDVLRMMKERFADWRSEMDKAEPRGPFRDY